MYLLWMKPQYKKATKQNLLDLTFIDLKKAIYTVARGKVWKGLREKGMHEKVIRVIQDIYIFIFVRSTSVMVNRRPSLIFCRNSSTISNS